MIDAIIASFSNVSEDVSVNWKFFTNQSLTHAGQWALLNFASTGKIEIFDWWWVRLKQNTICRMVKKKKSQWNCRYAYNLSLCVCVCMLCCRCPVCFHEKRNCFYTYTCTMCKCMRSTKHQLWALPKLQPIRNQGFLRWHFVTKTFVCCFEWMSVECVSMMWCGHIG